MGRGTEAIHFMNTDTTVAEGTTMYHSFRPRDADLKARREYKAGIKTAPEPEHEQSEFDLF